MHRLCSRFSSYAAQTYNAPGFAEQYGDYAKSSPVRMFAERWIQSKLLGDLQGKRVLDLACGDGVSTRWLQSLGAREVVGVDVSAEMVRVAQERTLSELPIKYLVGDAVDVGITLLEDEDPFDVVLGNYLLNYATTEPELVKLLSGARRALAPSGFFVGVNDFSTPLWQPNGVIEAHGILDLTRYGVKKTMRAEDVGVEGAPVLVEMFQPDTRQIADWPTAPDASPPGTKLLEFLNFYLSDETYDRGFVAAGFAPPIERHHLATLDDVSPEGQAKAPDGWWDEILATRGGNVHYRARAN